MAAAKEITKGAIRLLKILWIMCLKFAPVPRRSAARYIECSPGELSIVSNDQAKGFIGAEKQEIFWPPC